MQRARLYQISHGHAGVGGHGTAGHGEAQQQTAGHGKQRLQMMEN